MGALTVSTTLSDLHHSMSLISRLQNGTILEPPWYSYDEQEMIVSTQRGSRHPIALVLQSGEGDTTLGTYVMTLNNTLLNG